MTNGQFVFLCIIAERKLKEELSTLAEQMGGALVNSFFGRGYYESKTISDYLGFGETSGKVALTCLITSDNSQKIIEVLDNKYSFKRSGTGIAFAVPVETISY